MSEVWILGATGRIGRAVAEQLTAAGIPIVLVGRDATRLSELAGRLLPKPKVVVVASLDAILKQLKSAKPAVVFNAIGPFTNTALPVIQASGNAHYLDLSNELPAALATLAEHGKAVASDRTLVTGAGWGVLSSESIVLKLCKGEPPASSVRVDNQAATDDAGPLGEAIGLTIAEGILAGGSCYRNGQLVSAQAGGEPLKLTAPDGYTFTTGSMPSGEMEAARRASGAPNVVSAAGAAPTAAIVRYLIFPLMGRLMKFGFVLRALTKQFSKMPSPQRANVYSWSRAYVVWPDGRSKEGWLKAGEGMEFTAKIAATIATRLFRGEGKPGAYTPGALFGPDLVTEAGGSFI
jgi:short subunit dehydrogenase-like uncharacterized protein